MKRLTLLLPFLLLLSQSIAFAQEVNKNGIIIEHSQSLLAAPTEKKAVPIAKPAEVETSKISESLLLEVEATKPVTSKPSVQPPVSSSSGSSSLLLILVFAFLGGMILNLMPCVLPILSLKILNLKNSSNKIAETMSYTAGVLLSFIIMAIVVLAIKATGASVGWGFQMQSPGFIIFLIFLFSFITFNLLDFFNISFSMNMRQQSTDKDKLLFSFFTGVLAVLVTTPCSAPFMATAIGFTLSASYISVLMIFISLGLGFAFPYLIVGFFPVVITFIPKPGNWMNKFREFLCFPMIFTVIWLFWVLAGLIGYTGQAMVMVSLCMVFFSIWLNTAISHQWFRRLLVFTGLTLAVYPLLSIFEYEKMTNKSAIAAASSIPYNYEKLDRLVKQDTRVFSYVTAAWCITCKVNEKVALNTDKVQNFFKDNHIIVMKADWTQKSDYILEYLKSFKRMGAPLYVYYPEGKELIMLPQILTPDIIIDAIKPTLK